ncbi:bacteriohemerythrin [Candidatus Neomarinimicrobiota bacterium]
MTHLEWVENYSVGIENMDNHHRKIIDLINDLHNGMSQGSPIDVLHKVLLELSDYTMYHFSEEENLMKKYDYSNLLNHKKEHGKLIKTLKDLQQQLEERKGELVIIIKIQDFLRNWWVNHILNLDMKYGIYLNSKEVS